VPVALLPVTAGVTAAVTAALPTVAAEPELATATKKYPRPSGAEILRVSGLVE
jgi:hypothetical protein